MDIEKYISLIKKSETIKDSKFDLLKEDKLELYSYDLELEDQIFFNSKTDYLSLLEEFASKQLTLQEFGQKFYLLYEADMNLYETLRSDFNQLSMMEFNEDSRGFYALIEAIDGVFESLNSALGTATPKDLEDAFYQILVNLYITFNKV